MEEDNGRSVDGFIFVDRENGSIAKEEIQRINYISSKMNEDNPEAVLSVYNKMIESNKINWNYDINSVQIVHPSCLYNKEFSMFIEHFLNHGNVINRDYISIDKSQIINFQNFITIEDLKKYPVILNDLKNWYIQCLKSEYGAQITYEAFLICKKLEIFKDNTQYSKNGGYIKLDALTSLGEKYLVDLK